jgi:hypothetical protein
MPWKIDHAFSATRMSASAPGFGPVVKADAGVRAAGERALDRTFLLLDVLPDGRQWRAADRSGEVGSRP